MNAVAANEGAYANVEQHDYDRITVTDRGVVFKTSENELIWMEVEGASDVLIDDALLPQEEMIVNLHGQHHKPGRPPRARAMGKAGPPLADRPAFSSREGPAWTPVNHL